VAFPRKLLAPGEDVVLETHPNWSILVPRTSLFLLVVAVCVAIVVLWSSAPLWFGYVLLGFAGLFFLALLAKIVMWRSTTLVLTNRRVVYRTGVFRRLGREIPLDRVQDVTYTQSLAERLVGAGSLTIESAGAGGEEPFPDIRHPAEVQSLINRLITAPSSGYGASAGGGLGGYAPPQPQYPQPQYPQPQYQQPQYSQPQYQQPQYPQPQYQQPQPPYQQAPYQQPAQLPYQQPPYAPAQPVGQPYQQPPPQTPYQAPSVPSAPSPQPPPQAPYQAPSAPSAPPSPQPAPSPPSAPPNPAPASAGPSGLGGSSSEQLKRLEELLRLGVITDAEYELKRRELVEGLSEDQS
jgi:membrane protein YdbS with pleckstrin-like domain